MTISADDARKVAKKNERLEIQNFVSAIDARIQAAVSVGKLSIEFDMTGSDRKHPGHAQREAIQSHYVAHGYKFKEHCDADPNDPRERNWTEISWA